MLHIPVFDGAHDYDRWNRRAPIVKKKTVERTGAPHLRALICTAFECCARPACGRRVAAHEKQFSATPMLYILRSRRMEWLCDAIPSCANACILLPEHLRRARRVSMITENSDLDLLPGYGNMQLVFSVQKSYKTENCRRRLDLQH